MTKTMLVIVAGLMLVSAPAWAQNSPGRAPPPDESAPNPIPDLSTDRTTVFVTPDPSATSMATPQSAAEYGSPSAVDSPSSPMPDPASWPTPKPSGKRPKWVQKAPARSNSQTPPPPH